MAPATDQLTAPPAAPSLPPGYDSNTGTVPAESTGIAPAPKPTAPLAATSAAPSLGEKLTSLKSQVWKSITSNTNDQKAEQAWAKHAAQTDAENAAHEKMYQDDPETFKKQYPFEWLHRKVYDTVKNAVEAEPEKTAAPLGPKAKQNIDALVQTGLQQIGVTPPSQKTTMEGVALPIGGPIGEIEPSMEVLGPSARRVANAPQLPEHAAEPIDVQGHVLDEHGNPTASTVPAGKLDDLGTRLPDLQTADLAERRDVRSRLFPSGNQTRIGQTANRTFDVIRQNEAEANAPTIEHREVSTYGSGSEAPQPMQQVRLQQNGKTIGRVNYVIDPDTNIASVRAQGIDDPNLRGKGYGQQMVLAAADQARARGATALTSDLQGTTSMDAARVWDKLAAKGHPVEKIPSKAGSPGYTMDLTKPSPLPQYGQALSERGELPGQTVQLGDLGAKYVGKAPSQITTSEIEPKAASYHPDLQKMADKYGVVPSPSGGTEASSITPDGKFIRLPAGGTHDTAIDFVTGRQAGPEGDNRIGFLNDTGSIRLRVSNDKAGKTAHISIPAGGVTEEQIPAVQQAIAAAGRNGNVVMERADVTPETQDQLTMSKEFPRPGDAADYLRQIQAHPDQHAVLQTNEKPSNRTGRNEPVGFINPQGGFERFNQLKGQDTKGQDYAYESTHEDFASNRNTTQAELLKKGWVRKAGQGSYQTAQLNPQTQKAIENDILSNYGDLTGRGRNPRVSSVVLEVGNKTYVFSPQDFVEKYNGDLQNAIQGEGEDLQTNEHQSPLKEPYAIEITGKDGATRTESVDAFSSKDALKTAQKKFPDATEWSLHPDWSSARRDERDAPSTEYVVPTGKLASMPVQEGREPIQTIYHELGHAMIGEKEGLTQKGMLRHTHPDVGGNRAGVLWSGADLFTPARTLKPQKLDAVVNNMMGGIAADEIFNDLHRAANWNFDISRRGGDGNQAYRFLRDAGYTHDQALERMHKAIDQNKDYLTKPEVSGVIKENAGVREPGLSTQYHYSPERLKNMHLEAQRRIANGTNTEGTDNGTAGGGSTQNHPAVVARGEGGVSETAGQEAENAPEAAPEVNPHDLVERAQQALAAGNKKTAANLLAQARAALQSSELTTAEIKKPSEPWAETAGKAMAENGAFTINPRTGEIPNTGHWLEAVPELRQVSDKPSTPAEIQKFAAQPAVKKALAKYPELHIGGYKNDAGKYELNLSASSADPEAAKAVATKLDRESTWDAGGQKLNPAGGKNQKTNFPDYPIDQRLRDLAPKEPGRTISTRYPSAVAATEDPLRHGLALSGEKTLSDPKMVEKYANEVKDYPGFTPPEGADAKGTVNAFINHVKDNLEWLYKQSMPAEQEANKGWYDGAHQLTKDLADKHGYTHMQTAGVTAALSPQKDWDMNVSLAKRLTDIVKNHADEKASPEMIQTGKDIVAQTQEVNPDANAALQKMFNKIKGKSLDELIDPTQRAAWVRLYDEANNPREVEKIGPDGKPQGLRTNLDGSPTRVTWGSLNTINKALSILNDGSRENISRTLGGAHKIRSFYNNIIDPNSKRGDVTIDTHAVAAGLLRPLGGFDSEVVHNFNSPRSSVAGLKGTYPLYHAAYTEAAKDLDIPHLRMLQSVVWEKIRKLFPAEFKTAENNDAITAIWKEKEDGKITADQARQRILDYAESHRPVSEGQQAGADQGQLPLRGVYGESAEGHERNRVSAGTPVEDDTSFNFGANAPEEKAARESQAIQTIKENSPEWIVPKGKISAKTVGNQNFRHILLGDGSWISAEELEHDNIYHAVGSQNVEDAKGIRVVSPDAYDISQRPTDQQRAEMARIIKESGTPSVYWDLYPTAESDQPITGAGSLGDFQRAIEKTWPTSREPEALPPTPQPKPKKMKGAVSAMSLLSGLKKAGSKPK